MKESTSIQISNNELLTKSKNDLNGIWIPAIGAFFMYLIVSTFSGLIPMGSILLAGPLTLGLSIFSLNIAKNNEARFEDIFEGFKKFGVSLGAYLLMLIFVLLWTLLLVIPGIIAAISYSQTFFIIAENDELDPMEALRKSKEMMNGHKMDYFILGFVFFCFIMLSFLTLGIALIWLMPFMQVTLANFYLNIRPEIEEFDLELEDNLIL